jgi:predicted TIM-barrel fold metal-dependent hydrolase
MSLTRRELVVGSAAAAVAFSKASQPSTKIGFKVPADAVDCHTHIFGDAAQYPWFSGRGYTPEPASPEEMRKLHRAMHVDRVIIVQPSVYGSDNSATLFGMKAYGGPRKARGVAVVDAKTSDRDLQELDRAGVRGLRINSPTISSEVLQWTIGKAKVRNWHVQINSRLSTIRDLKSQLADAAVPIVIDHVGAAVPDAGVQQPGFQDLVDLVRSGKAYVKVTHNFMSTSKATMFEDAEVLAKALLAANPERILWGTDWPHPNNASGRKATEISPLTQIDDGKFFNHCASWLELNLKRVLVNNPTSLYGF